MDNATRQGLPSYEPAKKHVSKMRRFYDENKDYILWGTIIVLGLKNSGLRADLRVANKKLKENKEFIENAKVQLEALSLFDQAFGPRRIHGKHT